MKIINYKNIDDNFYQKIDYENLNSVAEIVENVRRNGDSAVIEYSAKFNDGVFRTPEDFLVTEKEIENAYKNIPSNLLTALKKAILNVEEFSKKQFSALKNIELKKRGSVLGHKIIPLNRVLCYCPGGNYPLLSSCYMSIIPAKIAGVKEIFLTSPKISDNVIVSAHLSGANKIYKIGGAQAVALFGYGSETVKAVDKIVGPGNKYVAGAKKILYGQCGIDFIAGPSEVLIVASDYEDAKIIAADMLAQCEHDIDARSYLITDNMELAQSVQKEALNYLKTLKTTACANISFEKSICVIVDDINQSIDIANKKAPEHLELLIKDSDKLKDKFLNYGSMFIGKNCAEVFGDYCSGTNHILPTNQCSRYSGGLSVFDFVKIQTYQKLSIEYSKELSKTASILSEAEGLYAHKLAGDLRS